MGDVVIDPEVKAVECFSSQVNVDVLDLAGVKSLETGRIAPMILISRRPWPRHTK
jgi:hypothetical protein